MSCSPILIVHGEPNSIFFEIFFKSIKKFKIKRPLILIASKDILEFQMKKLNFKKKIKILDYKNLSFEKLNNKCINLINIKSNTDKEFKKISTKSNNYISKCFKIAFHIIEKYKIKRLINGPINKKTFLNKNYLGITEYISKKFKIKNNAMLIFNKNLSVCPLTTHLPLKKVSKNITQVQIKNKIRLIDDFYKKIFKFKPKIAVVGLNPHCETTDKFDEDKRIIRPAIKFMSKKNFRVFGPFSSDTIFLAQNRSKYDVILGMYHDQVLAPIKTLFEYDAINLTLGLPFLRISPDHGPNEEMVGKNISNPLSLARAISFLDKN